MKICFITFEYPPFIAGGAGGYAECIVPELSKLGHDVYVIAPTVSKEQNNTVRDINVVRVPIINMPSLRALTFQLRLKKVVSELEGRVGRFDILHANGPSDFMLNSSLSYPRVVTVHHAIADIQQRSPFTLSFQGFTGEGNPIGAYMERKTLSRASKIISVSAATKKFLLTHYNLSTDQIFVIYNGIYADNYHFPEEEIIKTRTLFGVDEEEKLLVCAPARINEPRKGIKYLLEALAKVSREMKIKCVITGSGKKETFDKYLKISPPNSVHFPGRLNEGTKRRLFAACDLFVMPSLLEGCPLAILEAMASSVPIVATNVGGIPELVNPGRNGLLVEPRNSRLLAEAIISLLQDEKKSKEIRRTNYNDAHQRFNWKRAAKLTEEVYKKALVSAGKPNG